MSGIILLSSKGKAPGLLRLRLATAPLLPMIDEKTFCGSSNLIEILMGQSEFLKGLVVEIIEFL